MLNARVVAKLWSDKATRSQLPHYNWKAVMQDTRLDCGLVQELPEAGVVRVPAPVVIPPPRTFVPAADWGFQ